MSKIFELVHSGHEGIEFQALLIHENKTDEQFEEDCNEYIKNNINDILTSHKEKTIRKTTILNLLFDFLLAEKGYEFAKIYSWTAGEGMLDSIEVKNDNELRDKITDLAFKRIIDHNLEVKVKIYKDLEQWVEEKH